VRVVDGRGGEVDFLKLLKGKGADRQKGQLNGVQGNKEKGIKGKKMKRLSGITLGGQLPTTASGGGEKKKEVCAKRN